MATIPPDSSINFNCTGDVVFFEVVVTNERYASADQARTARAMPWMAS